MVRITYRSSSATSLSAEFDVAYKTQNTVTAYQILRACVHAE